MAKQLDSIGFDKARITRRNCCWPQIDWRVAVAVGLLFLFVAPTAMAQSRRSGWGGQDLAQSRARSWAWISVDSLWMTPSGSDFRSEILDPNNNAVTIAQTLDHGFPAAPRFRISSLLLDSCRTEFTYYKLEDWSSMASVSNVPPTPDLDAQFGYDAGLENFELNLFSAPSVVDTQWMVGLRRLEYQDSVSNAYQLDTGLAPVIEETADGSASNELFGPQFGLGFDVGLRNVLFRMTGKLGLMNNDIRQRGVSYDPAIVIDGNPEPTFDNESDEFVWLGDIEASISYHLSRCFAMRLGYQGLFLDRIAQSALQNGSQASPSDISFHGFFLGAEYVH